MPLKLNKVKMNGFNPKETPKLLFAEKAFLMSRRSHPMVQGTGPIHRKLVWWVGVDLLLVPQMESKSHLFKKEKQGL